jgi:3-oxoacyl-[acyl-carrier protein] reductase
MDLELSGKTALVTGSSRGIGHAIAAALHAEGCRVALNGRDRDALAAASAALPGSAAVAGDVSEPQTARRVLADALEQLGRLDILICNVGSGRSVPPGHETYDEWQRVFALNLWSATNAVEAARPALAGTQGSIVLVSSICGLEVVPGAPVTYAAAKAALHAYMRGMVRPLAQDGVRVNMVSPGNIVFPGSSWDTKWQADPSAVRAMLEREVPLRRLGTPEEIAAAVVFLASARAAFITGTDLTADAGQSRRF